MTTAWTTRLRLAALIALAALLLFNTGSQPFHLCTAFAQSVPPPDLVDWKVDRTTNGFNAYWEFSPRVEVYLNLYRRSDGVNVASQDLGTGSLRGNGVYRYTNNLSTPTVKADEEYTLDVTAEDLTDPSLTWRFTFIVPEYGTGGGLFSDIKGWLRAIRDALNPLDWVGRLFSFAVAVATTGRGINQFLCDVYSWASGQTPATCID
ncbi:MAG: hypothetical protein HY681_06025 [Chloroflexi bacterium]|nr:hypothetical protein [Chloroflexota bacterium]